MERIDGTTRLYGIVGDPIHAVRSPQYFNALFAHEGRNAVFLPLHVGSEGLSSLWAGVGRLRNLDGLVFTMPHKVAAAGLVDILSPTAQAVGAINAARREADGRWRGEMFDGQGFVDGLLTAGHVVRGKTACVLGLGGAGAAIALALAQAGVAALAIDDVNAGKRAALAGRLRACCADVLVQEASPCDAGYDFVVNATPLGMHEGDPLPFEPARLPSSALVVDIITKPEMTPLLKRAESLGRRIHTGRHMHAGQAARAASFFGLSAASGG
jgi:shikimate dehydrogenase